MVQSLDQSDVCAINFQIANILSPYYIYLQNNGQSMYMAGVTSVLCSSHICGQVTCHI